MRSILMILVLAVAGALTAGEAENGQGPKLFRKDESGREYMEVPLDIFQDRFGGRRYYCEIEWFTPDALHLGPQAVALLRLNGQMVQDLDKSLKELEAERKVLLKPKITYAPQGQTHVFTVQERSKEAAELRARFDGIAKVLFNDDQRRMLSWFGFDRAFNQTFLLNDDPTMVGTVTITEKKGGLLQQQYDFKSEWKRAGGGSSSRSGGTNTLDRELGLLWSLFVTNPGEGPAIAPAKPAAAGAAPAKQDDQGF